MENQKKRAEELLDLFFDNGEDDLELPDHLKSLYDKLEETDSAHI